MAKEKEEKTQEEDKVNQVKVGLGGQVNVWFREGWWGVGRGGMR